MMCVYSLPGGHHPMLGSTLEDAAAYLSGALPPGWSLDGVGYLTVPCDGVSPETCDRLGCVPVTTMDATY